MALNWFILCAQKSVIMIDNTTGYYEVAVHPNNINVWYQSLLKRKVGLSHSSVISKLENLSKQCPENLIDNYHNNIISKNAKKKITRSLDYLIYFAQPKQLPKTLHGKGLFFQLNFITLTLASSQCHSDLELKKQIFEPFLNSLRQKWKVKYYVWRTEKQANGNMHWHICTDKFIHWAELRAVWNNHQNKLGYVDRYRENMREWHANGFNFRPELSKNWPLTKQLKAYKEGILHDWNQPNSTDIHSLKLVTNVRAYFVKYMTKNEQNLEILGRLWGCSENLSHIEGARDVLAGHIEDELCQLMKNQECQVYKTDFFTCVFFDHLILNSGSYPYLYKLFEDYIASKFSP
jgi:hypothetical protein